MDYVSLYADFLKNKINLKKPLHIICDASNGATGIVIRKAFGDVSNLTLTVLNETVDGEFPAHGPNPILEIGLKDIVPKIAEVGADIGAVYDGDGDRVVFVDGNGNRIPSFAIATILFKHLPPPYIGDEHVYKSLQHINIIPMEHVIPSLVGTYNIKKSLRTHEASAAAELSGHYYYKDFFYADSGLMTTVHVLNAVSEMEQSFTEYVKGLPPFVLENTDTARTQEWAEVEAKIIKAVGTSGTIEKRDGVTIDFGTGWVNIRASNTEPLLRLTAGATNTTNAKAFLQQAVSYIK